MVKQSQFYKCEIKAVDRAAGRGGFAKLPERSSKLSYLFGESLSRLRSSRVPFPSRNSTPCFSNVTLIALRFRSCMRGLPSTLSAREIAECDTPHRLASSRADQLRSARAARSCTPVIVGFKASDPQKWPLTRDMPLAPINIR
jgi:hypothetical protein